MKKRHRLVVALLELEKEINAEGEDVHQEEIDFGNIACHLIEHLLLDGKRLVAPDHYRLHDVDVIQRTDIFVDVVDERTVPFGGVHQIEFLGKLIAHAEPARTLENILVV